MRALVIKSTQFRCNETRIIVKCLKKGTIYSPVMFGLQCRTKTKEITNYTEKMERGKVGWATQDLGF